MVALGFGFIATMLYFFYRASLQGHELPPPRPAPGGHG
jgi:hypothetical protein